jgi:hypothetical protein
MNEHQDKRHPVSVSHVPAHWLARVAPTLAAGCMLFASPAWAKLEILFHALSASTEIKYSNPAGTETHIVRTDTQNSLPPFVSFVDDGGRPQDGIAESFADRPGITQGRQLYAASVQRSTSNAVAAQTTYTGGTSVAVSATTRWRVIVKNSGTAPEPVDLSFFISGGGLDAWCANCFAGGLVMSTTARVSYGINDDWDNQLWVSRTELDAVSTDRADLRNGARQGSLDPFGNRDKGGSYDPAGIGFLTASMVHVPDTADPYFRASIDPFNATLPLFTLQPGLHEDFSYFLEASVEGSGTALGAAWLVDPFSLGSTDIPLPGSGFALNGVPITSLLVPEPSQWFLMLVGTTVLAAESRRRSRRRKT